MDATEPTRTRQNGTQVTSPATPAERIAAFRSIVERGHYAKIDGKMVDLFSASLVVKVYDALSEANRTRFAAMTAVQMASLAYRLVK